MKEILEIVIPVGIYCVISVFVIGSVLMFLFKEEEKQENTVARRYKKEKEKEE